MTGDANGSKTGDKTGAAARNGGRAAKILLVEDDPAVRDFLKLRMELYGYAVVPAGNGPEALERLHERDDIDLLFSDIVMPGGITGVDLAEIVERDFPGIKIMLASGYAGKSVSGGLDAAHRFPVLGKPIRGKELEARLAEILGAP